MHGYQKLYSPTYVLCLAFVFASFLIFWPHTTFALTSITTCSELQNITNDVAEDYVLANDIDCSGISNFTPIGSFGSPFTGTLDGQGYAISDLSVSTTYAGMFASIGTGAMIENLGFVDPDIDGHTYSGVLTSYLQGGTISHVYVGNGSLVCASAYCGGLVGYMFNASSVVTSSYSNVNIYSGTYVGGIVGRFSTGTIDRVYATGVMTGSNKHGILGSIDGGVTPSVSNSFYDEESTTATDNNYGTPTTTAAMMTQSTFSGWNFTVAGNGTIGNWIMAGYPHLQMEHRTTITDVVELQLIAVDRTEDYTISGDISAASTTDWNGGAGFNAIGDNTAQFTGSLNGGGYTISGLYINRPSEEYVTLIGYLHSSGSITHLRMTDADFTGDRNVAGFVGISNGTLSKLSFSGTISGDSVLGGIAGENLGILSECQSDGTIDGTGSSYYLGGITGNNAGTLTNSYSSMDITGHDLVGGLVGENANDGIIQYSYASGAISAVEDYGGLVGRNYFTIGEDEYEGTVENSFYDSTTSGQSDIGKGTGKTTAQMKLLATFTDTDTSGLDTAWDFVGTPNDDAGTTSTWEMDPAINSGYAFLAWQQSDSNAPSSVTSLTSSNTDSDVTLSWTNPTASDFISITVRRSTSSYPSTVSSGTAVVSATTTTSITETSLDDGVYYYSVFALDNTGNASSAATTSVTIDTTAPVITLIGSATISQNQEQIYTDAGATATDAIDGDITDNITTSGSVNTSVPGTYTITYSVSDSAGNVATSVTRTVTILSVGGGSFRSPGGVGNGSSDQSIGMYKIKHIGEISFKGVNLLAYFHSTALFSIIESSSGVLGEHRLTIADLDLSEKKEVIIDLASNPQTIFLKLGASAGVDLDGDGISDLSVMFVALWNNRVELTLKAMVHDVEEKVSILPQSYEEKVMYIEEKEIVQCPSSLFMTDMEKGYYGPSAMALQQYLNSIGMHVAISGPGSLGQETLYFGSLTQQALITFQKEHSLAPTGVFDVSTRKVLGCTTDTEIAGQTSFSWVRNLEFGMYGEDVKELQKYLNKQGFVVSASGPGSFGNETNYFGIATENALKLFQLSKNIVPASGYFGSVTMSIVNSL